MKIYVETEMKELPIVCVACDLCKVFETECGDVYYCNSNIKGSTIIENPHTCEKPKWCPLRTESLTVNFIGGI